MSFGSCAAVLKTASRANPAVHLPYRPRGRATPRTASRNVRRYDWSASSGSVVGNDPVNNTDPTGEATACDNKPCPTLQGTNPTATKVAGAVNSAIRTQNSTSTVAMKGATVSVQTGTRANTTVSVKTPVGSVTMSGTAQPSTNKSSVTISGLRVSSTIGSVTSAPSSVTVFNTKSGELRYHIDRDLVISKNILVTTINVVNVAAGDHIIK
jgi:hypothetical protein